ncbi:hypothetical protein K505DRAFT_241057 [Melanomma pulvis-pyrius CBS 109.77]|uniref:Rhodopsin domain-containing protein n=1 Tax=Melanomma pulvis-pyrius CBS 109.77 TaxID=1314802 RepID=A0A6A6XES2_9PLEO|nr:hypothetical protein K505DRAFT_241057 [Melanomma pulvis-pyrius CBS 109.77]
MATEKILLQMLANPPDPNEALPLSNRRETILGTTIPFLIISWMAILFRLYVRFRIVREPGWDDFFVVLAGTCNTIATTFLIKSTEYGLGHHLLYNPLPHTIKYQMMFYVENGLYITEGAIIKISLLFQYLRIFKAGTMRWISLTLLVIISLWGLAYSIMTWVPCFPIREFWDRKETTKCYGFGFNDQESFIRLFESHTALNMVFDFFVFVTPLVLFKQPHLRLKNIIAMTGVFLIGGSVVFISIWRLYTIVEHRAATHPYIDFTWWSPITLLLSCLEINLAIICASMPIFWPVLEKSLSHIFVTSEVRISTEQRYREEAGRGFELAGRSGSVKSTSGNSRESLTREPTNATIDPYAHYKDRYILAQVDPFWNDSLPGARVETEVASRPKPKWAI